MAILAGAYTFDALGFVGDVYPQDHAKREALARCTAGGQALARFSSEERNACYAALHLPGYNTNIH